MIAFLCVASAGFEIFIKTSYNSEVYKPYFDLYMTLWPSLWTPGEALRTQKILLPLILSFVLFALDATFDRLPENPQDPLKVLNNITDKQDELIKKAIDILEKVRLEVRNEPATDAQDIPYRSEIEAL